MQPCRVCHLSKSRSTYQDRHPALVPVEEALDRLLVSETAYLCRGSASLHDSGIEDDGGVCVVSGSSTSMRVLSLSDPDTGILGITGDDSADATGVVNPVTRLDTFTGVTKKFVFAGCCG